MKSEVYFLNLEDLEKVTAFLVRFTTKSYDPKTYRMSYRGAHRNHCHKAWFSVAKNGQQLQWYKSSPLGHKIMIAIWQSTINPLANFINGTHRTEYNTDLLIDWRHNFIKLLSNFNLSIFLAKVFFNCFYIDIQNPKRLK